MVSSILAKVAHAPRFQGNIGKLEEVAGVRQKKGERNRWGGATLMGRPGGGKRAPSEKGN